LIESGENGEPKLVYLVYLVYLVCLVGRTGKSTKGTRETRQTGQTRETRETRQTSKESRRICGERIRRRLIAEGAAVGTEGIVQAVRLEGSCGSGEMAATGSNKSIVMPDPQSFELSHRHPALRLRVVQAVNLGTVVKQVCHSGKKRWTMRLEKTPDPFSSPSLLGIFPKVIAISRNCLSAASRSPTISWAMRAATSDKKTLPDAISFLLAFSPVRPATK
jgi:hypothetical protein